MCRYLLINSAPFIRPLTASFTASDINVSKKGKGKGKDVDLYSAFHASGTPNAHTSLKLTRQNAI